MTLDPTLRDQLAKTIHDATCPCVHFPDSHPTSRADYLNAADKAAELLTAPRFPDGWERGHEAKYWAQTGLTPYGLTLDPERAPGVLNWLGVNYYTPDSPHLPASAAAPVVLPTVEEVALTIMQDDGYPHREMAPAYLTIAQAVLDLIASRVRHWVPVEPGTIIKVGTRVRRPYSFRSGYVEYTEYEERAARDDFYIDPATVPAEPEDPRVELLAEELEAASGCCFDSWPCSEADRWYRDARLILARLDAVRADA